jgi:guanylate kinase
MLLILCGKSGSGKDAILRKLVKYGFIPLISHTTRPRREKEIDGKDYYFVSDSQFQEMKEKDKFIEYRVYNTVCGAWYYGLSKKTLDKYSSYITISDIDGAKSLIDYYGKKNCIVIYVSVDDKIRKHRAIMRGSFDRDEWNRRLKADEKDFSIDRVKETCNEIVSNEGSIEDCLMNILVKIINKQTVGD